MTAEIGILNRRGIALAADSALTIGNSNGNSKTMNSAVKLFTLDSAHYIGIMIYGNAEFMSVPWEVIIKSYREKLNNGVKKHVKDYVYDFISYVSKLGIWESKKVINPMVYQYQIELLAAISDYKDKGNDLEQSTNKAINNINDEIEFSLDKDKFTSEFSSFLVSNYNNYFKNNDNKLSEKFVDGVYKLITSNIYSSNNTGVVIAGYGSDELFPVIYQLTIDGIVFGRIKYRIDQKATTDPINGEISSSIMPFAQQEMVHTVISGIDPELNKYRAYQLNGLENKLVNMFGDSNQKVIHDLLVANNNDFESYRRKEYTDSVVNMLDSLSIDELGSMAETLVSLTSFKRKFSGEMQTVGGPIDVLTISRGEGPIWMKRKQFFDFSQNKGYELRRK